MLYDAGPRFGDFDLGQRVVLPALHKLGVERIDLMLLSHADADHAGGALAVSRGLKVTRVISGDPPGLPAILQAEACESGRQWQWDGSVFNCGNGRRPKTVISALVCCRSRPMASVCC
ncbi:MBL fold metallo-hydrolase [Pseudomonas parakoreensis]